MKYAAVFFPLSLAMVSTVAADRFITVVNACSFPIWPAFFTASGGQPEQPPGWEALPNTDLTFSTPDNWNGRVWGRRNCDFSTNPGPNSCLTGGCNGGLVCNITTGTGVPPATLATFDFSGDQDIYTVSVVDGTNLPISITNTCACPFASCPVDLVTQCPPDLAGPFDSDGVPVGCKSACLVDALAGNPGNSSNCCTGSFNSQSTCPTSGVEHYNYFKSSCPKSFVYPFDESSGTAIFQCEKSCMTDQDVEYEVTFCPQANGVTGL
ncbi:thaumatin [Roridomyces roridus]|uniref:Thaumatin n=1 Tax=Roridomyces roridus TaxID=1738132 RepID=A0AAD7BQ27_9AGAR|nr:thaumatin [Roridomyces roridus]